MPKSIEHGQSFVQKIEKGDNITDSMVDIDSELRIKKYWHEFGFPGEPPHSGTPVLGRLLKNCQQYESYISNPKVYGATGSEGIRRETHNQIARMIYGRDVLDLGDVIRERLCDFACLVSTGLDSRQLGELATRQKMEE